MGGRARLESPSGETLCCSAVNFAPSMTCVLKRHDSSLLCCVEEISSSEQISISVGLTTVK